MFPMPGSKSKPPVRRAQSALILLDSKIAAAVASVDFTQYITGEFDKYVVDMVDIIPATDGANLLARVSEDFGVTFKSGATDYGYANNVCTDAGANAPTGSTGANAIVVAFSLSNVGGRAFCGEFKLFNPAGTAKNKRTQSDASYVSSTPNLLRLTGAGTFSLDTNAINGLRFLMSAGNITSGTFSLYAVRK